MNMSSYWDLNSARPAGPIEVSRWTRGSTVARGLMERDETAAVEGTIRSLEQ